MSGLFALSSLQARAVPKVGCEHIQSDAEIEYLIGEIVAQVGTMKAADQLRNMATIIAHDPKAKQAYELLLRVSGEMDALNAFLGCSFAELRESEQVCAKLDAAADALDAELQPATEMIELIIIVAVIYALLKAIPAVAATWAKLKLTKLQLNDTLGAIAADNRKFDQTQYSSAVTTFVPANKLPEYAKGIVATLGSLLDMANATVEDSTATDKLVEALAKWGMKADPITGTVVPSGELSLVTDTLPNLGYTEKNLLDQAKYALIVCNTMEQVNSDIRQIKSKIKTSLKREAAHQKVDQRTSAERRETKLKAGRLRAMVTTALSETLRAAVRMPAIYLKMLDAAYPKQAKV